MRHVKPLGHPESVYFPEIQTDNIVCVKEGTHGGKMQHFRFPMLAEVLTYNAII